MKIRPLHPWDLTPKDAVALQRELAHRVDITTSRDDFELIAGTDVSYNRFSPTFYAAVIVMRRSNWSIAETATAVSDCHFPYVPGLLSFREMPILLAAFAKLRRRPELVITDGLGYAHPRRFGIACHLGIWLNLSTIGYGKSRLVGTHEEPGPERGQTTPLFDREEVIGEVVRTKRRTKPLFVSAGHRIDLPSAVRVVLEACRGYRLPEPTRLAHLKVNELRRAGTG